MPLNYGESLEDLEKYEYLFMHMKKLHQIIFLHFGKHGEKEKIIEEN